MAKFQLTVNVAGVQPFEPGFQRLPTGAYPVQIKDVDLKASNDPQKAPSLQFDCVVADGPHKGVPTRVYVGTDFTKDGNKRHLRALFLGMGANPAALDQGNITVDETVFVGKPAWVYVEEAPEGATQDDGKGGTKKQYDNRNFVAPEFAQKKLAEAAAGKTGAAGATAQGAQGTTTGATANGAGTGMAGLAGALGGATGAAPQPTGLAGGALFGGK